MHGFDVQTAQDSFEASALAQSESFAAIIAAISISGLDGFQAVEALRALPLARSTPILVFTALADDQTRCRARELGANGVLQKPILPQELLALE